MNQPSDDTIRVAEGLFKSGHQVRSIARETGLTRYQIEILFFPERVTRRRERNEKQQQQLIDERRSMAKRQPPGRPQPPPAIFEERERAYSMPQNILGDPPLGRSALERRASHG